MSQYADNFIKQHKEYFKRNKAVIENNIWNEIDKRNEGDIDELFDQISELREKETRFDHEKEDIENRIEKLQTKIFNKKKNIASRKSSLFKEENKLTESILGRLSAFIKETESNGDRKLEKVQKFIDYTADIILIHIQKSDKYLDYSLDSLIDEDDDEDISFRSDEIAFQDEVFTSKISIQDTLSKLNITDSIDNFKIEFFKGEKASIPMIDVLPLYNDEIKELTEKLELPTEVDDITFHIHRKKGEYPEWDSRKHYWEQEPETLRYWYNEWLKIKKGFWVDGYFFHPWLYDHLNFFKTPIPSKKGGEEIRNPDLRDNEWFIAEELKAITAEDGYYTKEMLLIFGTRRFSKALRDDQVLYYEDGERPIGEAKTGDIIYDSEGKLTNIIGVYPQGKVELYEVEFGDGRKSICCDEHLWSVFDYQAQKWKTLPLKEIVNGGYSFERNRKWKGEDRVSTIYNYWIPITKPVEYSEKLLLLDPYYLGLWLGDGCMNNNHITTIDEPIKKWIKKFAKKEGLIYKEATKQGTEAITVKLVNKKGKKNNVLEKLRSLDLIRNKHIPEEYFYSSIEQRMELLRGMLDTDGTIGSGGGGISFTSADRKLAEDFRRLCFSLGINNRIDDYKGNYIKKDGSLNTYTKVTIFTDLNVFKLNRKLDRIKPKR